MKKKLATAALTLLAFSLIYFSSSSEPEHYIKFINVDQTKHVNHASGRLLDLTQFEYLIKNDACKTISTHRRKIKIVQIVTSYAGEVTARRALRQAYSRDELEKLGVVRVFLLGALKTGQSEITQSALLNENDRFGDLLQGNFIESYKNLTYKHAMGLGWAGETCSDLKYVIKMDDDIVVNMYEIVNLINNGLKADLTGYVFKGMRPIRMKANKWYVTKEEYDRNYYPSFLSGWLYITTPATARQLALKANSLPYFWIDDVFLTGVVVEAVGGLTFQNISRLFTTHPEILDCCVDKHVACEFFIGPTGGDFDLQTRFQKHAKMCSESRENCRSLPDGRGIEAICVAKRKLTPLGKGLPSVNAIKV